MSHSKQTLIKSTLFVACMLGSSASTMVPNRTAQNHGQFVSLNDVFDAVPHGYVSRGIKFNNGKLAINFSPVEKPENIITCKVKVSELDPKKLRNTLARKFVRNTQSNTRQPLSDITNIHEAEEQEAVEILANLEELAQTVKKQKTS